MAISRTRLAPKLESVLEDLRSRIVKGEYLPGDRLPIRSELEGIYDVSWATLQKAFDMLREDGFVETRGRHGTFVAGHPPHLSEYGLVFPHRPSEGNWARFYATMLSLGLDAPQSEGRRISLYYSGYGDPSSRDCRELLKDVERHRLAGLILCGISGQSELLGTLPPWLPKVAIVPNMPNIPAVDPDHWSFWHKALAYLRARGRRRVACFSYVQSPDFMARKMRILAEYEMEVRPYWTLLFEGGQSPGTTAHLLTRLPKDDRPEALIVSDDNLVESTMTGLVAGGIRVPDEMELVVHCSFPNPPPAILPAKRIGFDCRQLLHTCCEIVDKQRRGESVPAQTVMSALYEEELVPVETSNRAFDQRQHAPMSSPR